MREQLIQKVEEIKTIEHRMKALDDLAEDIDNVNGGITNRPPGLWISQAAYEGKQTEYKFTTDEIKGIIASRGLSLAEELKVANTELRSLVERYAMQLRGEA